MVVTRPPPLILALAALLGLTTVSTAHATIQCWTNRDGLFECADRLPPEYAQQRTDIRNRHGVVIDTREAAKSREEIQREATEADAREAKQRRRAQQAAHDRMLLSTYIDEHDLASAAKRNLLSADGAVTLLERNAETLREQAEALKAVKAKGSGRGAATVEEDLARTERQLALVQAQLDTRREERDALAARFDADLKRFRELKPTTTRRGAQRATE